MTPNRPTAALSADGSGSSPGPRPKGQPSAFPFTAIVGMDSMELALCLAAVGEHVGGVLVRGEKGTAKTTMVRGLAGLLGEIDVVPGCRFACDPAAPDPSCPDLDRHADGVGRRPVPLVELPVGASEDRVAGSLHLDSLLARGHVTFEPGLLAAANRGVLYVDEVNLLPDHLVDGLLDAAATGRARVEREGVSVEHAARFVLVGTMNPEEGDLRPQLLDRFGLVADAAASRDPDTRVEVITRRLDFERDAGGFADRFAADEEALARRITRARAAVAGVEAPREAWVKIARICAEFDVDGMRGDLVTARTASAHAAWQGRSAVSDNDIRVAARLALPHRRRRNPFDTPESAAAELEEILQRVLGEEPPEPEPDREPEPSTDPKTDEPDSTQPQAPSQQPPADDRAADGSEPPQPPRSESDPQPPRQEQDRGATQSPPAAGAARSSTEKAGKPHAAQVFTLDRVGQGVTGRRSRAVTTVGRQVRGVTPLDPRGR
ncbi:ATP-binding protein, partial [Piscicoccus intestinalis]|uniref:ATP-binding protein n=1 Tax=Piscicoccus intestinalis TaxID=746033 RepID=UPI001FDF999D